MDQLVSSGPHSGFEEKLSLFGQFIGDWEIVEDRFPRDDGSTEIHKGELHWRWILEGMATQDVWMWFDAEQKRVAPVGTTLRFPNGDGTWQSIWIVPMRKQVRTFTAHGEEGRIVLEGTTDQGHAERWMFHDIQQDSFRWKAEEFHDSKGSWKLTEEMYIRRMSRK